MGKFIPSSCSSESKGDRVPEAIIILLGFSASIFLKAMEGSKHLNLSITVSF